MGEVMPIWPLFSGEIFPASFQEKKRGATGATHSPGRLSEHVSVQACQ